MKRSIDIVAAILLLAVVVVVMVVVGLTRSNDQRSTIGVPTVPSDHNSVASPSPQQRDPTEDRRMTSPRLSGPTDEPTSSLPLGSVTFADQARLSCPEEHECVRIQIVCAGIATPARAVVAIAASSTDTEGLVMLLSGGGGDSWWTGDDRAAHLLVQQLRDAGLDVVQLRWERAWLRARAGEDVGPARLACRPATAIDWVFQSQYEPRGVSATRVGRCGFCVTGNSGGASQVAYGLSHYGLDEILDAVVLTSGPPHAALAKGCVPGPSEQRYAFRPPSARIIDSSYGMPRNGPCVTRDESFVPRWEADAVDTGGVDYSHETTRIHFLFGGSDGSVAPIHASDYLVRLEASSPLVTGVTLPGVPHRLQSTADGTAALLRALLQ